MREIGRETICEDAEKDQAELRALRLEMHCGIREELRRHLPLLAITHLGR